MLNITEERGRIVQVADGDYKTVFVIESKKGAKRANHWHKTDTHVMYLISGKARYVERGLDQDYGYEVDRIVLPGESINTLPHVAHAMEFLEDSVMVVCSTSERDEKTYLAEIVPCKIL